jgi:hypothetical protein
MAAAAVDPVINAIACANTPLRPLADSVRRERNGIVDGAVVVGCKPGAGAAPVALRQLKN